MPVPVETSDYTLDALDRQLINRLQDGFPICEQPYKEVAQEFGIDENELITRIDNLLATQYLSRFGPMYHAERMGGGLSLAAMSIPAEQFAQVADIVNSLPEVAHNYERDHKLNMWFVIATEEKEQVEAIVNKIQQLTGHPVYNMPKIEEFYVGLRFAV